MTLAILGPIENILTEVLIWFHETVGLSWAWSIVAVTVAVRVLLVPVAIRQIHSMQSLQIHAPEMKAIQQRYKNDRQKQSEELMKFYRENKINPYASCLPIVLQIPIFIALFFVLRNFEDEVFCSEELGGRELCSFPEGEKPTALPEFESQLEWLDLINITANTVEAWGPLLLVVYVISQLTSTWLMSTAMQSAAQRWLIMVLPIVFIPFILGFPSGLMIYWLTTNLWSTGQGLVTRRLMPRPVPPPKRSSRTPPREAPAAVADGASDERAAPASSAPARSGPPRRVKRRKGGGGRRR
jgi:YidC/Oxa1 family membrane protein insertase